MNETDKRIKELEFEDISNPDYMFDIFKRFIIEDQKDDIDPKSEKKLNSINSEFPSLDEATLSEFMEESKQLLIDHKELTKEVLESIQPTLWLITTLYPFSKLKMREIIQNFPTNETVKEEIVNKRLAGIEVDKETRNQVKSGVKTYFDYDHLKDYTSKFEYIIKPLEKNKNFLEYMYYAGFKELFSKYLNNYWNLYFDFLNLSHRHFPELFNKKFDFSSENRKINQDRIRNYIKVFNEINL